MRENSGRRIHKIVFWVSTLWLVSGMLSSGILQLIHAKVDGNLSPPGVYGITHLGFPVYFLTILGIWKILGCVAVLVPRFPLVKEWTYAGFFFVTTGAIYSHLAVGDPAKELFPATVLLIMTVVSWYFRAADRKIASTTQYVPVREFGVAKSARGEHVAVGA